jgi:hypothetical protein
MRTADERSVVLWHLAQLLVAELAGVVGHADAADAAEGLVADPVVEAVLAPVRVITGEYDLALEGVYPDVCVLSEPGISELTSTSYYVGLDLLSRRCCSCILSLYLCTSRREAC